MSLESLSLGERIVMAARWMAAEHLRQEADAAGINVRRLQNEMAVVRRNERSAGAASQAKRQDAFRQDLFRQPAGRLPDDKEAA